MTTGRWLSAVRPWAARWLRVARELAQGSALAVVTFFGPLSMISEHEQPARSREPTGRRLRAGSLKLQLQLQSQFFTPGRSSRPQLTMCGDL